MIECTASVILSVLAKDLPVDKSRRSFASTLRMTEALHSIKNPSRARTNYSRLPKIERLYSTITASETTVSAATAGAAARKSPEM